jgi:hypothetical protein
MASLRRALWYLFVLLGIAVFGGALAVVLSPGLGEPLPVEAAIDALGSDYLVVAGLGVLALAVLVVMLVARAASSVDEASSPDPEFVERVPVLGAEFDDLVENGLGVRATYFSDEPEAVREDLREKAIRTLVRTRGLDRETARDRVEAGRWTDNRVAAEFLATGGVVPRSARVRAALRGESWLQYGARVAAEEVVALAREAPSNGGSSADTGDVTDAPGRDGSYGGPA